LEGYFSFVSVIETSLFSQLIVSIRSTKIQLLNMWMKKMNFLQQFASAYWCMQVCSFRLNFLHGLSFLFISSCWREKNTIYIIFWSQETKKKKNCEWDQVFKSEIGMLDFINFLKKDDLIVLKHIRIYIIYFNYIVVFNVKRHVTIWRHYDNYQLWNINEQCDRISSLKQHKF